MTNFSYKLEADVARLPQDAPAKELSATIVLDPVGYLSVEILFLDDPVQALDITFYYATDQGHRGNPVTKPDSPHLNQMKTTDAKGRCHLDFAVPIGNYICEIPYQHDAVITTVEDVENPFVLVLPIGRPYFDLERTLAQGDFK